jgi:hypothetical protein
VNGAGVLGVGGESCGVCLFRQRKRSADLLSVGWQNRLDRKARGDIESSEHTWQHVTSVNTAEREKLLHFVRKCKSFI